MLRRLLRPLWFLLALIFLIEAWLWDHLEPVVARIVAAIPLARFKAWLAQAVAGLSPALTLIVFLVPLAILFPLKLLGYWLLAHRFWWSAAGILVIGKLVGVGVTAFVFDITRPQLLQLAWFRTLYTYVLDVRAWAQALVEPFMMRIRATIATLRAGSTSYAVRRITRLRRWIHSARRAGKT